MKKPPLLMKEDAVLYENNVSANVALPSTQISAIYLILNFLDRCGKIRNENFFFHSI